MPEAEGFPGFDGLLLSLHQKLSLLVFCSSTLYIAKCSIDGGVDKPENRGL